MKSGNPEVQIDPLTGEEILELDFDVGVRIAGTTNLPNRSIVVERDVLDHTVDDRSFALVQRDIQLPGIDRDFAKHESQSMGATAVIEHFQRVLEGGSILTAHLHEGVVRVPFGLTGIPQSVED